MAKTDPTPHEIRKDEVDTPQRTDPAAAGIGAAETGARPGGPAKDEVPGRRTGTTSGAEYVPGDED